ncbi:glycosyltransferase family 4 protein [Nakamurella lactea]|uniref:glycosyltransferase family 4 protein n=1 Tax=Nakamurella lactea TaxID=459515 RepID=UPI0004918C74|nr:glycosyltransferase family 4 protein [Nakamurella lactea]
MKVIIATSITPFVFGGATLIVDWLVEALENRGHEVETYRIPVHGDAASLPAQLVGLRQWDFTGHGDRLIAIRTPSHLVRHHSKVVWFLHHHRAAYDLFDRYPQVKDDADGREFRRMLFASDDVALGECEGVFVNSAAMAGRLSDYNGINGEVLYPPLGESLTFDSGPFEDTLVYVSRVVDHKRQLLAVQAVAETRNPVKLVLAGSDAGSGYAMKIFAEIDRLGVGNRVAFMHTVISERTKRSLLTDALGVVYIPLREDSYGFAGLEAVAAGKPIVTTADSGGVLELVKDGVNGIVCAPTSVELAAAFDRLYEDRALAQDLGAAQRQRVEALNISWDHVIERLLA